jgi:hypothetical protein
MIDPNVEIEGSATALQLTAHEYASLFPMMSDDELAELIADIDKHGLREPIVLYEGRILDGRNRVEACRKLGIEDPRTVEYDGDDAQAFVVSKNLHRRHLTQAQKAEVVVKLLVAQPERSDREIAKLALVDPKTAASKRAELEARMEIPHVERRKDTKGRSYPAHRESARSSEPAAKHADGEARESAAVVAFIGVLHKGDIYRNLDKLLRLLRDEKERIAVLPKIQREALARGFLAVLDIVADEPQPIVGVPGFPERIH